MSKIVLLMIIIISLASCSSNIESIESNNKLIIAKDGVGLYLWNGKGQPNQFQSDCFKNKKFIENPFSIKDSNIRVSTIDKNSHTFDLTVFNWTDYNIDLKKNSCNFMISHKYSHISTHIKAEYTTKRIKNNDTITTSFTGRLPLKFIGLEKGWIFDTLKLNKPNIEAFHKSNEGNIAYLQYQGVYFKNEKLDSLIFKYRGNAHTKTGNGIYDLDISDDGQIIVIPILKTNLFQWLTYTGKGEVLLYDVNKHMVIKTINERMLRPKISPDKKQIAYFHYSNTIMIYDILTGKSEKIFNGSDFEWLK